jgi:hypothetical protein
MKDYVFVEELIRNIPQQVGSFQPLFSIPLRKYFPRRGKITTLTNLPLLTTTWELVGDT